MKLEEAIQIRKKAKEPEELEEGFIGDAVRILSAGAGLFYGSKVLAGGILASITGISLTPVVFGVGGAIAVSYGVKKAFDFAKEIESRQLMKMVDSLAKLINERDQLLASYGEAPTRKEKRRIKKKVDKLTEKQQQIGMDIKSFVERNDDAVDSLTYEDIEDINAIINAAEKGKLTTLEVNK